jgi:pilus assembly protein CpaF
VTTALTARTDHALVGRLRTEVAQALRQERRLRVEQGRPKLHPEDEQRLGWSLIRRVLQDHHADQLQAGIALPTAEQDAATSEAVHAALFGLGRLQPLINDQTLQEINICGCDDVWLIGEDGKRRGEPVADSDDELVDWVRTMATYTGLNSRPWDLSNPHLEFRLPDGSRLVGLLGAVARPVISIRLHRRPQVSLTDLRARDTFDDQLQSFLNAAVLARQNFMVSGETGAGKTTLLRAMCSAIPPAERLVTVEHFLELGLGDQPDLHHDVVALRAPCLRGQGCAATTKRRNQPGAEPHLRHTRVPRSPAQWPRGATQLDAVRRVVGLAQQLTWPLSVFADGDADAGAYPQRAHAGRERVREGCGDAPGELRRLDVDRAVCKHDELVPSRRATVS